LDNMDGKQARKTGNSSPLGMLYDHGLDAASGWLIGLNLAAIVGLGNTATTFFTCLWVPLVGFYFTMWEEYHLDFLNFGAINPVDEGMSFINSLIIFTGFVGSKWWSEITFGDVPRSQYMVYFVWTVATIGIITNIFRVISRYRTEAMSAIGLIRIPLFLMICGALLTYCSPSDIVTRRTRSVITCFGLGFSKVIGHIQLAHCAGDKFNQWRKSFLISSTLLVSNTVAGVIRGKCPVDEDLVLNLAIICNLWSFVHYFLSITQQLTRVLECKVFSIKKVKA